MQGKGRRASLDETQEGRGSASLYVSLSSISTGGIYHNFNTGNAGAAAANCQYITRATATDGDLRSIHLHNYADYIGGETYDELRQNIIEYNRQKEQDELSRPRRGGGKTRTHYRVKLSFEGKVNTDKAREMAAEYLRENFPKARAVAAIHQDTKHTHAHINIQARDVEGKKINLTKSHYRQLDERWGWIYAREFGEEKLKEHLAKKQERQQFKQAKARDESRTRPARAGRRLTRDDYRAREIRNYGDEAGTGRDQRAPANATHRDGGREPELERLSQASEQAVSAARGAIRETESLRADLARLGERSIGRGEGRLKR